MRLMKNTHLQAGQQSGGVGGSYFLMGSCDVQSLHPVVLNSKGSMTMNDVGSLGTIVQFDYTV